MGIFIRLWLLLGSSWPVPVEHLCADEWMKIQKMSQLQEWILIAKNTKKETDWTRWNEVCPGDSTEVICAKIQQDEMRNQENDLTRLIGGPADALLHPLSQPVPLHIYSLPCWGDGDLVGWLPWPGCGRVGIRALWEGQDGKRRRESCPWCQRAAGAHGALPRDSSQKQLEIAFVTGKTKMCWQFRTVLYRFPCNSQTHPKTCTKIKYWLSQEKEVLCK